MELQQPARFDIDTTMSNNQSSTQRLSGSCLCGTSTFTINSPIKLVVCHCNNCKKWSGSAFAANMQVLKSDLTISDSSKISTHVDTKTKSGRKIERHFCSLCGSNLYINVADMPDAPVVVTTGVIDGLVDRFTAGQVEEKDRLLGLQPQNNSFPSHNALGLASRRDRRAKKSSDSF